MREELERAIVFVEHIKKHIKEKGLEGPVQCKICGKSISEIYKEDILSFRNSEYYTGTSELEKRFDAFPISPKWYKAIKEKDAEIDALKKYNHECSNKYGELTLKNIALQKKLAELKDNK